MPGVFFSSRRRHTRLVSDWSSDVCSSDLGSCRGLCLLALPLVILGPCFGTNHGRHAENQGLVERRAEANGLRKHRRGSLIGDAMERLAPPVISGNLQTRYGSGSAAKLRSLLLVRHPREEIVHALVNRQRRIQIRRAFTRRRLLTYSGDDGSNQEEYTEFSRHGYRPIVEPKFT